MSANDHHDANGDEIALKRARLKKVEDAIEHTVKSLADLREVRDALRAELGLVPEESAAVIPPPKKSAMTAALDDELHRRNRRHPRRF